MCGQGWWNGYSYTVGEAFLEGKSSVNNSGLNKTEVLFFSQKAKLVGSPEKKRGLAAWGYPDAQVLSIHHPTIPKSTVFITWWKLILTATTSDLQTAFSMEKEEVGRQRLLRA